MVNNKSTNKSITFALPKEMTKWRWGPYIRWVVVLRPRPWASLNPLFLFRSHSYASPLLSSLLSLSLSLSPAPFDAQSRYNVRFAQQVDNRPTDRQHKLCCLVTSAMTPSLRNPVQLDSKSLPDVRCQYVRWRIQLIILILMSVVPLFYSFC